jgi:TRAP-type uncharacterized transport system substrate-binding protein
MTDRKIVRLAVLGVAAVLSSGHTPYGQWYAYRAKHLIVVSDKERSGALPLASAAAAAIAARWPESRAVAASAQTVVEVVKLLRSGQLPVGLVPKAAAQEAFEGRGPFADDDKVPLRVISVLGDDLLVVLDGFTRERARDIAQAIAEAGIAWPGGARPARGPASIPLHAGALDYYEGRPAPGR